MGLKTCVVCGVEFDRTGKRGPVSSRCFECLASDRRVDRVPIRLQEDRKCVRCGVSGPGSGVSRKYCGKCRKAVQTESQVRWGKLNLDKRRACTRRFRERHPELCTGRYLAYGISREQFESKLAAQGGKCAICGATEPGNVRGFCFDHSHSFPSRDPAGHREILCHHCNSLLGNAKDSVNTLGLAIKYLKKWGAGR
jgi:hypothetical protein